ncbi:hypothetical protein [Tenacibaculum xiamenense]|uniref:hypothetical protein n=1 Tax=Tenacibaculum xiamenense TaxID=1261553 RepID=UPI003895CC09
MKNWIISRNHESNKHLIVTEKSIWITEQPQGVNINDLIETKSLGTVKSIRYESLKEIVFIDSDLTIEFKYKDNDLTDEEFTMEDDVYNQISTYLKSHLKGVELKKYSVFKQILPQLISIVVASVLSAATFISALEIEKGNTVNISGRRSGIKMIMVGIAEVLGSIGTLILGVVIIGVLVYFLVKTIKNPKEGEVLKTSNSTRLTL